MLAEYHGQTQISGKVTRLTYFRGGQWNWWGYRSLGQGGRPDDRGGCRQHRRGYQLFVVGVKMQDFWWLGMTMNMSRLQYSRPTRPRQ
jgi:hypothetical protein